LLPRLISSKNIWGLWATIIVSVRLVYSAGYPDQFYTFEGSDSLLARAQVVYNVQATPDGKSVQLGDDKTYGYLILPVQTASAPFNYGLPSWNGTAEEVNSYFKVFMRFFNGTAWSDWLTVGYWHKNYGNSYGKTYFSGGRVNIDEVELNSYFQHWQFKVDFWRNALTTPSPTICKLSFFMSDTVTTGQLNYTAILSDNPPALFLPTTFYYQYGLDPEIGGSICSPTSVSMILRSYGIEVEPVQFARDTYDDYWGIFGIWPRVVQNAAEYGLDGAVKQYRTWSQAYEVLNAGGRIAMSVGKPLYSGHLMMLAGFDQAGRPIVHDPAKSNGYAYVFNKESLSHSWFDKGGVGYTFFRRDTLTLVSTPRRPLGPILSHDLITNYPNPFNSTTQIRIAISQADFYSLAVYNLKGELVDQLFDQWLGAGEYQITWSVSGSAGISSGLYLSVLQSARGVQSVCRLQVLK